MTDGLEALQQAEAEALGRVIETRLDDDDHDDALIAFAIAVRATERAKWLKSMNPCAEHMPTGGARSRCVICSGLELSRAISRIDYALGEQNEQELSLYDEDYDAEAVIARVVAERARAAALVAAAEEVYSHRFDEVSMPSDIQDALGAALAAYQGGASA